MEEKRKRIVIAIPAVLACAVVCLIWGRYFVKPYNCPGANIILISVDTLRSDHMGCYGYGRMTTSSIDRFAEKSVFFEQAYAPWPKTTPSFGAFFTGMHPFTIGVERISPYQWLDDKLLFLSEILKNKGYFTQARVTNPHLTRLTNFNQGFDVYDFHNNLDARSLTKLAVADLKEISENTCQERFLYWIHYMDPHAPYDPPEEYMATFINDKLYDPDTIIPFCEAKPNYIKVDKNMDPYERTRRERILRSDFGCLEEEKVRLSERIAQYDGEISFADKNIGILLDEIAALGLPDNSIIVLWSDHGESLGDHNYYFDHGRFPYNPCMKVPLIIHHPNIKPKKIRSAVNLIDVFPTLLGILKVKAVCEGEDIKRLILDGEEDRTIFACGGYAISYQKIMTDGKWKLIYIPDEIDRYFMTGARYELYDLRNDPEEKDNLYGKNIQGMYLREEMDQFLKNSYREYTAKRPKAAYFPETLRMLKSLGYIE